MSLIDGLILKTLSDGQTRSKHSILMEFYETDKVISSLQDEQYEKWSELTDKLSSKSGKISKENQKVIDKVEQGYDLTLYFLTIKAKTLYYQLNN